MKKEATKKKEVFVVFLIVGLTLLFLQYHNSASGLAVQSSEVLLQEGGSCTSDVDCEAGYLCKQGQCALGCLEDEECPQGTCDLTTGRCIAKGECNSDEDCLGKSGKRCDLSTQKCVGCLEQSDCTGDFVCNTNTNACEAPLIKECTETDGGKNYDTSGMVTARYFDDFSREVRDFEYRDKCFTRPSLKVANMNYVEKCRKDEYCFVDEVYCTEEKRPWSFDRDHRCEFGCEGGACVQETPPPEPPQPQQIPCEDPDGNEEGIGKNKGVFRTSTVKGSFWQTGEAVEKTDYCSSNTDIGEYYCQADGKVGVFGITCPNGCKDGACVQEEKVEEKALCIDVDGEDVRQATTVSYQYPGGEKQSFADTCIGSVGILEGSCLQDGTFACLDEKGKVKNDCRKRCSRGEICQEGACTKSMAQCTDTDGENKNQAGEVTVTDEQGKVQPKIIDGCIGYFFVEEAYCTALNQGRLRVMKCAQNEVCLDGRCKPSPESCTDADGRDRTSRGKVSYIDKKGNAGEFTDRCKGNFVEEGICKVNTFLSREIPCPASKICSEGACVSGEAVSFTCSDSDGLDVNTVGKVSFTNEKGKHEVKDACLNQEIVIEQVCYRNNAEERRRLCIGGQCRDGKCM